MTTQPRARRAFWGDVRFLVGIALVILSIVGVWLIVSSARQTTPVLQANRTITQGESLVSDDFRVVEVSLGSVVEGYLSPQDLIAGLVASRTLADGDGFEAPRILAADVVVASVPEASGMLAQRSAAVELVIDRADVAAVLAAITGESALSVVPLGSGS